jgi:hypothetical protein
MRLTAWTLALALAFSVGLNLRAEPVILEPVVVTDTVRNPLTDTIVDILSRDVRTPETDEQLLYTCFLQLVDDQDWHAAIAYLERKWAGDSCQALDHYRVHGWW